MQKKDEGKKEKNTHCHACVHSQKFLSHKSDEKENNPHHRTTSVFFFLPFRFSG